MVNFTKSGLLTAFCMIIAVASVQAEYKVGGMLSYGSIYESNVFHAYADSLETSDMMNALSAEAFLENRVSSVFKQYIGIYSDFDLYASKSDRNRVSYGLIYEPYLRYSDNGRLRFTADLSKSKRDLIDDAGDVQTRILEKDIIDLGLKHYYRIGDFYTTQEVNYVDYNYDESYSGTTRLTSFDFHYWEYNFDIKYVFTDNFKVKVGFSTEKRNYDERKSYSLDKLYYETRSYRRNLIGMIVYLTPAGWLDLGLEGEFGRRKENFENFYGNDVWKWKIDADLRPLTRHRTELSFSYRTKDYDNYYTNNIGIANRVHIDYTLFRLEHYYEISYNLQARLYLDAYNKVSNDIDFDYQDTQAGLGFIFEI